MYYLFIIKGGRGQTGAPGPPGEMGDPMFGPTGEKGLKGKKGEPWKGKWKDPGPLCLDTVEKGKPVSFPSFVIYLYS